MWLILAVFLLTKLQQLVNWIYHTAIRHNRDLYKFSECTNNENLDLSRNSITQTKKPTVSFEE